MKADLNYSPSDVYETMPLPPLTGRLDSIASEFESHRKDTMLRRQSGLTGLYRSVHDPAARDSDIVELRSLHREIDEATVAAYGWVDLDLKHDFYQARQGLRFGICMPAQIEILDRLLERNHAYTVSRIDSGTASSKRTGQRRMDAQDDALF
jgi:hypothetical protein